MVVPAKRTMWELPDFQDIESKINQGYSKIKELTNRYTKMEATDFVDREHSWEAQQIEFFKQFDSILKDISGLHQKLRKAIETAFSNIMNGIDFGISERTIATSSNLLSLAKISETSFLSKDKIREKYMKKSMSSDMVFSVISDLKLTEAQDDITGSTATIYHMEKVSEDELILTGSWGFVGQLELSSGKCKKLAEPELTDFEIYNFKQCGELQVYFPLKHKPIVKCNQNLVFCLDYDFIGSLYA